MCIHSYTWTYIRLLFFFFLFFLFGLNVCENVLISIQCTYGYCFVFFKIFSRSSLFPAELNML